jgi:hypothetical protein
MAAHSAVILIKQRDPAAPCRISAGDIGTCCCRSDGPRLLKLNDGTTGVASIIYTASDFSR